MSKNKPFRNRLVFSPAVLLLALASCHEAAAPPAPPTPVNLFTVGSSDVLYYDNYPATTEALSQVDIRAQVQGYVTGIYFSEGQHVKKGQKLYSIDERLYQAAYDQAAANLKVSQGNQLQSKQDADRYRYLGAHNAVAKQLVDHAVIAQQNADNEVSAAEQTLRTARTNLTYSTIAASFDGTIGFSQVKLGDFVSAGTTVLNVISTDNPMAVDFLISESQLARYQALAQRKQQKADSMFTVVMPDKTIYPETGRISVIDRAVDPQTGTIRVRLVFPNDKLAMRAGMSCVVRVHNQETTPQMVVPGKAIVEQMGEYFVYLAKDSTAPAASAPDGAAAQSGSKKTTSQSDTASGKKLRAYQVRVQTGQTIGSNIIIESGLQDGDQIVVDGVQALHDGSPIATGSHAASAAGKSR